MTTPASLILNASKTRKKPWKVHRTGSHIGLKDADGKFIIRVVVSRKSIAEYERLEADFEHIVDCVNRQEKESNPRRRNARQKG